MAMSAIPITALTKPTHPRYPLTKNKFKAKVEARNLHLTAGSPYHIYLNSLAASGRNAMATLLNQCVLLLDHEGPAEHYQWYQLTFEKVHFVRSSLIEMGYAVNTVNLALAALKGVAKAAFNLGKMNADDMLRINAVKSLKGGSVRTGRRLMGSEIEQLLSCNLIASSARSARDTALLSIGIGAGLRCFEICSLNLSDVDLTSGLLKVTEGKGRKQRHIYLAPEILIAVKRWLNYRGMAEGTLFTRIHKDGKIALARLSSSGLSHALKSVQTLSGIAAFTPHDMRRTFITQLLEKDVDLNTVRQLAGHSDVSTTIRYDKRDVESQKRASQGIRF